MYEPNHHHRQLEGWGGQDDDLNLTVDLVTMLAGLDSDALEETVYAVLSSQVDPKEQRPAALASMIRARGSPGLALALANIELTTLDLELIRAYSRKQIGLQQSMGPKVGGSATPGH